MPEVRVIFYKEKDDETAPLKKWLDELAGKRQIKCIRWLTLLRDQGHDLRRPKADYLRDGIYELRVKFSFENYRILYFFDGRDRVVVTHGITKHSDKTPPQEIRKALRLKGRYQEDPESHTYYWEPEND